jgi:hypothetical protein
VGITFAATPLGRYDKLKPFESQRDQLENIWSYSDRPVALDSPFYIERPPIEKLVYSFLIIIN